VTQVDDFILALVCLTLQSLEHLSRSLNAVQQNLE
jgi:hypothetical protein